MPNARRLLFRVVLKISGGVFPHVSPKLLYTLSVVQSAVLTTLQGIWIFA